MPCAWLNRSTLIIKHNPGGIMKKDIAVFALVLGLGATAPAFAGGEKIAEKKQPVKMTEQQLDKVAGGQLIEVDVRNNEILKNINVAAQAAVQAAVLSQGNQGVLFRPINQQ